MINYYESTSTDPYFNLAMEEFLFYNLKDGEKIVMLWQNSNTVVVGRYQNTAEEIIFSKAKEFDVKVVRRNSGGGAVYHNLGNLNYSIITSKNNVGIQFEAFLQPVIRVLKQYGLDVQFTSRNDLVVDGYKISGNAQYICDDKILHHGTLLINENLDILRSVLRGKSDVYVSSADKSKPVKVANISSLLGYDIEVGEIKEKIKHELCDGDVLLPIHLSEKDTNEIEMLIKSKYETWDWNYGNSPDFSLKRKKRCQGGTIEVMLDAFQGRIKNIQFYGDFFCNRDIVDLEAKMKGLSIDSSLMSKLDEINAGGYIYGVTTSDIQGLLLEN